jgi:hypothetical protein
MMPTPLIVARTLSVLSLAGLCTVACAVDTSGNDDDDDEEQEDAAVVVADLLPSRVTWSAGAGPDAREHGAAFVTGGGDRVVVFGGSGYPQTPDNVLNDAWALDVATSAWTPFSLSGDVPIGGARRGVQLDERTGLLFGGYLADFAASDEAFAVDLETGVFRALAQDTPPPARSLHVLGANGAGDRVVVFGGFGDAGILNDTWVADVDVEADTLRWREIGGEGPSPRYGAFAGVDVDSDQLVVFSGAQEARGGDPINAAQDVWTFDLQTETWRERGFRGAAPAGRRNGCGVFDPVTRALLIFGGTADGATSQPGTTFLTIEADGELRFVPGPSEGEPPLRSSGFGSPLPGGGVVCGFGNDDTVFLDLVFWKP